MIDASPVAIIGINKDGTVGLWSAGAAAMFGLAEADAVGRAIAAVAPDPAVMALVKLWARVETEPVGVLEVEAGDGRHLAVSGAPLPDGGAVAMVADVHGASAAGERSSSPSARPSWRGPRRWTSSAGSPAASPTTSTT